MKVSSKHKRFKHINITGDTLSLSDTRSLIIRNLQRCNHYPKTDRILSVYDRTLFVLLYADMIARPGIQKVKTVHPINEMIPILVFYSYATKYHNLSSMFVPGYQCSNVYINIEKRALMNKDIQ